jgi:high-affinity iron transporter
MSYSLMLQSGSILLREGLEALLVIAALGMYLRRGGNAHRLPALYGGAALGVIASFALAWVFARFFDGAHNDLLEGAIFLIAAALMIYVGGLLFLRQDPHVWQAWIKAQAEAALAGGRGAVAAIASIAFLSVLREGAETVLFLYALAQKSGGWNLSLVIGLVAAVALLVAIFWALQVLALRLPLRPLFIVTSVFLLVMAIKFIGDGLREFQEMAWISYSPVDLPRWLEWAELNPSLEALGAQAVLIVAVIATLLWRLRAAPALATGAKTV